MQHIIKKSLLVFSVLFLVAGTACAASYEEGKHYKRVDQPRTIADGDKVEVICSVSAASWTGVQ